MTLSRPVLSKTALADVAGPCHTPLEPALSPLIDAVDARHPGAVDAIVFYGSCLRSGDIYDGLVDFYVVVDGYRHAHRNPVSALGNRLVPPNVYYLEAPTVTGTLRCKYAVISRAELARGCRDALLSSLWGRLSQPVAVVQARDEMTRTDVRAHLGQAVITLLEQTLPVLTSPARPAELFAAALALSYSGELRTERGTDRSASVVAADRAEYARRVHAARPLLDLDLELDSAGRLSWQVDDAPRRRAERLWRLRRPAGRALSVARLAKACFTFGNAVDYGAWKLARHTGVTIEVNERLRRHPLIFGWPVLWRLYRRGLLR